MKKYAIIGTGALGGYVAVRLLQAGFDVHCLFNSDYEQVKKHGLTLIADREKINIEVKCYQNVREMPVCDYIIVALKTISNSYLKEILPKIMHPHSRVILLQNGIGMEEELAEFIDPNNIIGSVTMLRVGRESPGVVRHFGFNLIEFAKYYPSSDKEGITDSIRELQRDFERAGFHSIACAHLPTIRWQKLVINIPISGLSVVLDASTQGLINNRVSFTLLDDLTKEVILAAKKSNARLPDDFYQRRLASMELVKAMSESYFSMKEDFNARRPLELRAIYENPIAIAKQHNAEMPLTNMLYHQLLYLNNKYCLYGI
jgi:2-dehydropantoate 2-reductase